MGGSPPQQMKMEQVAGGRFFPDPQPPIPNPHFPRRQKWQMH
jgi:hypothetical protein